MRTIEQLVNHQVLRWNETKRLSDRPPESSRQRQVQRPVICISREFGSGGAAIGRLVAAELGFEFYSQELVHKIAEEAHVRRQLVESLDERARDGISEWVTRMMDAGSFVASDYLHNLSKVMLTLGRHGYSVVIGRGGHLILDPRATLRVRTYASLETRITGVAAKEGLSRDAARAKVLRVDGEREQFYRSHFNTQIDDPCHFDLLVNTGTLTTDQCVALIVGAYHERFHDALESERQPREHKL